MSLLNLALAYVLDRRLVSWLTILSVSLATALILLVLNVRREMERAFLEPSSEYQLICGPAGSETALVLTALFHADLPRGNIPYETYEAIRKQQGIVAAYPFNLGDRYRQARIIGTTREFLEQTTANESLLFPLAQGRLFESDFELVVGAEAARRNRMALGHVIVGAHGTVPKQTGEDGDAHGHDDHEHESEDDDEQLHKEFPYTVVGILAPTGMANDRAMFTTLRSYWTIHGQPVAETTTESIAGSDTLGGTSPASDADREVTLILLRTVRPLVLQLQQLLPRKFGVMAVRPGEVLQKTFTLVLQPIEQVLLFYGWAIALVSASTILTTLYLATLARRRDLAILRAMGAIPGEIFGVVLLEAMVLVVFGCGAGVPLSQLFAMVIRGDLEGRFGIHLHAFMFTPAEVFSLLVIAGSGLLAAMLPAWQAYRSDVATDLGRGS